MTRSLQTGTQPDSTSAPMAARLLRREDSTPWLPDDPRHRLSPLMLRFFLGVLRRHIQSSFHAVRMALPGLPELPSGQPLIIYFNHPSWWDAALVPVLCRQLLPGMRAFAPIDAEALDRYPFMRRLGFFGVRPDSYRGATAFLRIGHSLLAQSDTLFCVTPEGSFTDPRQRPLRLRTGLATLISRLPQVTVLPLAVEYPFWNERRPEALVRFGEPMVLGSVSGGSAADIQAQLRSALTAVMDVLADDTVSRDAARFQTVLNGSSGISGIYDSWRRFTAALRGRRFDPAHGSVRGPDAEPRTARAARRTLSVDDVG